MADRRPPVITAPAPRPGRDLDARRDDLDRDRQLYAGWRRQIALLTAAGRHDEAAHRG